MKTSVFIAVLALLGLTVEAARLTQTTLSAKNSNNDDDDVEFSKFASKFKRSYKTKSEYSKRLSNYKKNKKIVEEENAKNGLFQLEMNKLSDLDDNEFQSMLGLVVPENEPDNENNA